MTDVIRDLPVDDRPRERLLEHGPEMLSDAELLAVILGTGTEGKNAIYLARELLQGGLQSLCARDHTTLQRTRGIGQAKAARIAAVAELSRRLARGRIDRIPFDVAEFGAKLVSRYSHYGQERLGAAILDARRCVRKQQELFVGTIDRTLVSTREIIRFALLEGAKGVVVYHNHPSGDPTPSSEDISFTHKLRQSLELVDLQLIDHLVIGAHRFYSMSERGQI